MRNLTIDNVEITGFDIGIHAQGTAPYGVTGVAIRNSIISRNVSMGFLGTMDAVMEGNLFEDNNFSGSNRNHAIYWSGSHNSVMRNNTFINNSVVDGNCNGGNVTFHGQHDGMLIENNTISQVASSGSCYGFSITSGYITPEWFRNFTVRGNTITNLGYIAIAVDAADGIVIENNRIRNTQASSQAGVVIEAGNLAAGDDVGVNAVVRDNIVCYTQPASGSATVVIRSPATGTETGTIYQTGAAASTGACAP